MKRSDFKIRHSITCTSRYFPESVSYGEMGCLILSLHHLLLLLLDVVVVE